MWKQMSTPWQICYEEAWKSYCNGSIPIGAVIVSKDNEVISRGRNMIFEHNDDSSRIMGSKIAHAEMNAIYSCVNKLNNAIIYSTMEPCVMCFGAIVMSGISEVNYAARDGLAGGTNLSNDYIKRRDIKINRHEEILEIVQLVIKTDYILRNFGERAENLLKNWEPTCPIGIQMGHKWYKENKLLKFKEDGESIEAVLDEICSDYITNWQLP